MFLSDSRLVEMAPSYAPPPNTSCAGVTSMTPSLFSTTVEWSIVGTKGARGEQSLVESLEQ